MATVRRLNKMNVIKVLGLGAQAIACNANNNTLRQFYSTNAKHLLNFRIIRQIYFQV